MLEEWSQWKGHSERLECKSCLCWDSGVSGSDTVSGLGVRVACVGRVQSVEVTQ